MIFGVETWNGTPMLVCEYLKAGTLADRLEERPLAVGEALGLGCDLASALQSIHSVGVLHRDIKPSNIGFSESRTAKLLDFGLARVVADDPATAPGSADGRSTALPESGVVGTPLYLAPEALRGEAPDARFDLWSLALVLYEAIAGRHPLEGATGAETRERLARMKIPDIRTYAPACPEPVARLLALALSRDAASRPASAGELLRQLRAVSVLQAA
jgi:serine/threonine protein kinase